MVRGVSQSDLAFQGDNNNGSSTSIDTTVLDGSSLKLCVFLDCASTDIDDDLASFFESTTIDTNGLADG